MNIRLTASGGSNGDGNYGSVLDSFRQTENDLSSLLSQQIEAQKGLRVQNELGIKTDAENQLRRVELDLLKQQAALDVDYLTDFDADDMAAEVAEYAAYMTILNNAQKEHEDEQCRLAGLLQDSVNTGYNNVADGTGSLDVQVCFVAGTKIRLKNGEIKTIEELKKGLFSRSAKHEDPTGEIDDFEIVELYENETDRLVEIEFENKMTGKRFSTKSTPEHPFFVYEKGWIAAEKIQADDECRSASDQRITVVSVSHLDESSKVYNFQVKDAHTYFVGETDDESVLVHNDCQYCGKADGYFGYPAHGWFKTCPEKFKQDVEKLKASGMVGLAPVDDVVTHPTRDADQAMEQLAGMLPLSSQILSADTLLDRDTSVGDKIIAGVDIGLTIAPLTINNVNASDHLKARWIKFKYSDELEYAGKTSPFGDISIRSGMSHAETLLTYRHESIHHFLTPQKGGDLVVGIRVIFNELGYTSFHTLRFAEEALAEGYATRSITVGVMYPFRVGAASPAPMIAEMAAFSAGYYLLYREAYKISADYFNQ